MPEGSGGTVEPTPARLFLATAIVAITILTVWKVIDYRTQPPPPPHPVGEIQSDQ